MENKGIIELVQEATEKVKKVSEPKNSRPNGFKILIYATIFLITGILLLPWLVAWILITIAIIMFLFTNFMVKRNSKV